MDSENYVDADELDSCWVQMGASCLTALCVIYIDPHGNVINCSLSSVSHRASYLLATRGSGSNQLHRPNSEQFGGAFDFNVGKKLICVRWKRSEVPGLSDPLTQLSDFSNAFSKTFNLGLPC